MKILVLNGPELDRLGEREPEIYGTSTLRDLESMCEASGRHLGVEIDFRQTNSESQLVDWILADGPSASGIVINPAIFTHRSQPVSDALAACSTPFVEVHISNIYARETWRRRSLVSEHAVGVIAGLGLSGYRFAIEALSGRNDAVPRGVPDGP